MKMQKGMKFGRLTVLYVVGESCICLCSCGAEKTIKNCNLRSGDSRSCGCLRKEDRARRNATHLLTMSKTYICWTNMKARCFNEKHHRYPSYGKRGITVCERWRDSFENFLSDMGEAPEGRTIDRIDVDGDYEPDNCRWATREQQNNNKRTSVKLSVDGELKTAAEWSAISGVARRTIVGRIGLGWDAKAAVFEAVRKQAKHQAPEDK